MTGNRDFLVGKRVTVIGLGIEGVDIARYAAEHGAASVVALDSRPPEALAGSIEQLRGLPISYQTGSITADAADRAADVAQSDILFVSQSIPLDHPAVVAARERGAPVSSMTQAFLEQCPGPVIGITGSSGKTTTTALVAHIMAVEGRPYRVGGNIGIGLLGLLDGMDERTWAVVEISHTQLQLVETSPHIAAILNVTPNHLDRFSWEDYVELKYRLIRHQGSDDYVVLNLDDGISAQAAELTPAAVLHFSMGEEVPGDGTFVRDGAVFLRRENIEAMVLPVGQIPLPGAHNVANVLAATAIASAASIQPMTIADAVRSFRAVPHRLEFVGEVDGVRYVNDSIATTPERALAGIRSFQEPLVLLLGGKDKDLPKEELAEEALVRCSGIVFFGADGPLLESAIEASAAAVPFEDRPLMSRAVTLQEAVTAARDMAAPGDVVLLSPACTSFDAYANFEERGEEFRQIVLRMAAEAD
jgi:UDP-N-acetylmuramoylalanine--D-glutamate ligase